MMRPSRELAPRERAVTGVSGDPEAGVALVMALIFSILLYILVAELVVSSRMVRSTGENDALLARMNTLMLYELGEAEDKLLADMAGAAAGEEGAGGLGAMLGGAGAPGGGEGGPGEEGAAEEDPTTKCDSSRDAWFEPTGHPDNDLTTYVWIEDENRKFNLLTIWSPDQEFAQESREGLARLIDTLRQDTEWDVPSSDAALIVQEIVDWARRPGTESMPVPPLKSRSEQDLDFAIPLHLDELMMLPSIDAELFFDKVIDQKVYLGLESVLTIWTSLIPDPGDPEKLARQRAIDAAAGRAPAEPAGGEQEGEPPGGEGEEGEELRQPDGIGIKVNVNTATWPVLRGLFREDEVPDRVIDGIIRYRSEVDEDATQEASDSEAEQASDFGDLMLGSQPLKQFFETLDDLEEVEEFAQIPDNKIKSAVMNKLTVNSEVFSIHVASLFKRNESERKRIYLLRRARSVVLRIDDGEEGKILPIVPFEERVGLRVQPVDMQDEVFQDFGASYLEMDQFSQDERAWNPFLVDFYLPPDVRQSFFNDR